MIEVVAAVVQVDGRFLLARRPLEKHHGGLWEFPGGKVEAGEDHGAAMRRELAEELGLEVLTCSRPIFMREDDTVGVVIHFAEVHVAGVPERREHIELGWYSPSEMEALELAPSDFAFLQFLLTSGKASWLNSK